MPRLANQLDGVVAGLGRAETLLQLACEKLAVIDEVVVLGLIGHDGLACWAGCRDAMEDRRRVPLRPRLGRSLGAGAGLAFGGICAKYMHTHRSLSRAGVRLSLAERLRGAPVKPGRLSLFSGAAARPRGAEFSCARRRRARPASRSMNLPLSILPAERPAFDRAFGRPGSRDRRRARPRCAGRASGRRLSSSRLTVIRVLRSASRRICRAGIWPCSAGQ